MTKLYYCLGKPLINTMRMRGGNSQSLNKKFTKEKVLESLTSFQGVIKRIYKDKKEAITKSKSFPWFNNEVTPVFTIKLSGSIIPKDTDTFMVDYSSIIEIVSAEVHYRVSSFTSFQYRPALKTTYENIWDSLPNNPVDKALGMLDEYNNHKNLLFFRCCTPKHYQESREMKNYIVQHSFMNLLDYYLLFLNYLNKVNVQKDDPHYHNMLLVACENFNDAKQGSAGVIKSLEIFPNVLIDLIADYDRFDHLPQQKGIKRKVS